MSEHRYQPRGASAYRLFDPLLGDAQADAMMRLCERFGTYGMYSQEAAEAEIGQGLAQRHDAVMNFLKTGGRGARAGGVDELVARTNYFREEYAYGQQVKIDGIDRSCTTRDSSKRRAPSTAGRWSSRRSSTRTSWSPARSSPCTPTCRVPRRQSAEVPAVADGRDAPLRAVRGFGGCRS